MSTTATRRQLLLRFQSLLPHDPTLIEVVI
jgi:hypothetical protein